MSDSNLAVNKFGKICRTCSSETDGQMKPLYDDCSSTDPCLVDMLMSCTFVQFHENDGLPLQICFNCIEQITRAYNFAKLCERTDTMLRECFDNYCNETNCPTGPNQIIKKEQDQTNDEQEIEIVMDIDNNRDDNSTILLKCETMDEVVLINCNKNCVKEEIIVEENNGNCKIVNSDELIQESNGKDNEKEGVKKVLNKSVYKLKSRPPYECKKCSETFPNFQLLKLHRIERKHPRNSYAPKICTICSKSVGYSRMNQHMRTHTCERPYSCEECGTRFSHKNNLRRHFLSRHSNEKPFKCDHCEKGFTRLGLLNDHRRTHTGERPFVCNVCGKAFAQSSALRSHMFAHAKCGETSGSTDHQCSTCGRCYPNRPSLKAHLLIHGEKRFLCSDCGRSFVNMIQLKSHSKVHTGLKPYTCKFCPKTFSHIGSLKTHTLIHTGEKPFTCIVCNRAFTQRNHLKYHMRTHSGERPYVCSVCGKTFALNGNLTVHMRTHTGETPYVCSVCGKGFHDSSSMKKHRKGHGASINGT